MSHSETGRLAGELPRMIVQRPGFDARPRALVLTSLRVLGLLALLALLCLGPARALEAGKSEPGKSTDPVRTVSGMNPGPLPKVATKPVATARREAPVPPVDATRPAEIVKLAEAPPIPEAKSSDIAKSSDLAKAQDLAKAPEPLKLAPKPSAYCASIADAAADARFAWQKEQLAALEKQVEARIARLEEKRAEYESWLARRNAFLAKADDGVVAIYTKMRADAAALQLANMPDDNAAAILTKLNARTASAILSEMEAARAAQLARMMTDAGRKARESEKS